MNEPKRWLSEDDLDPELAELLEAAEPPRAMTPLEKKRLRKKIARLAALPMAAGALLWLKPLAYAAVLATTAGGVFVGIDAYRDAQRQQTRVPMPQLTSRVTSNVTPAPRVTAPPLAIEEPLEEEAEEPTEPTPKVAVSVAASQDAAGDTMQQEAALLSNARAALKQNPSEALTLLAEHAAKFPRGHLSIEREMVTIEALNRAGRGGEARARAQRLLQRSPKGLYAERLKAMLKEKKTEAN